MEKLKSILRLSERIIGAWWYNLSSWTYNAILCPFMCEIAALLAVLFILLGIGGCANVKYLPMQTEERVEVRDSLIYIRDTVTVEIPKEIVKEIVPSDTISILKTSVATSEARLERGHLHHTLEQSGTIKTRLDTFYITRVEEKVVYQERPVEVEVPVKYVPSFYKFCLWWFIGSVILIALWIVMKIKP